MIIFKTCLIVLQINYCICAKKYNNYTLYRAIPVDELQLNYFYNISRMYDVQFWQMPGETYKPIDFIISSKKRDLFQLDAIKMGIYLKTLIPDVQRAFDLQTVKTYIRRNIDSFNWESYYRLNDIYSWMRDLSKQYPQEMFVYSIGKTHEYRDILAVYIVLKGCKRRSKVIVEGGIHAREWIAPAFVTYMINQIIHAPNSDDDKLKDVALTYQWLFVPVMNPDGYEYTHTQDRLWRKNRHGFGVDLNRNFDSAFGTIGVSKKKSSDTYCGPAPFSEKESAAMAEFIRQHGDQMEYYLAFHSYGQHMIIPYAHLKGHFQNFGEVNSDDIFNFVPNQARERIEPKIFKRNIEGQTKQSSKDLNKDLKPLWHIAKRRASNAGGSRTKVIKLEIYDAEDIIPEETCKCSANWCAQYVVENSYTSDIYINVESIMTKIHEIMQR